MLYSTYCILSFWESPGEWFTVKWHIPGSDVNLLCNSIDSIWFCVIYVHFSWLVADISQTIQNALKFMSTIYSFIVYVFTTDNNMVRQPVYNDQDHNSSVQTMQNTILKLTEQKTTTNLQHTLNGNPDSLVPRNPINVSSQNCDSNTWSTMFRTPRFNIRLYLRFHAAQIVNVHGAFILSESMCAK